MHAFGEKDDLSKNIAMCGISCPVQQKQGIFAVLFGYSFTWAGSKSAAGLEADCRKIVVYAGDFCSLLVKKVVSQKTLLCVVYFAWYSRNSAFVQCSLDIPSRGLGAKTPLGWRRIVEKSWYMRFFFARCW